MGLFSSSSSKATSTNAPLAQSNNGVTDASGSRGNSIALANLGKSNKVSVTVSGLTGQDLDTIQAHNSEITRMALTPLADIATSLSGASGSLERLVRQAVLPISLIVGAYLIVSLWRQPR